MKKIAFVLLNIFLLFNTFSFGNPFTEYDNNQVQEVLEFRLKTRMLSTPDEAINELSNYRKQKNEVGIQAKLSDEAKITIENMLILAEYSYRYEKNPKGADLKPFILEQYQKVLAWNEKHPATEANPYYLLSAGDLINSTMQYLPQSQSIKLGLEEKADYDMVRNNYPDLAFGFYNSALWYYFAPAIGGGSKVLAKDFFKKAIEKSECDFERFYSNIYYSQIMFEEKNQAECDKYLAVAQNILPGNRYIPFIKKMNSAGFSLLYYSNNREKVDSKIN